MAVNEGPVIGTRTAFVRELFTIIKDNPETQRPYREAHERQVAAAAHKQAVRERMTAISRLKRGRKPGSRPWQSAGFASRQAWLDATALPRPAGEVEPPVEAPEVTPAQTRREKIEARLKR